VVDRLPLDLLGRHVGDRAEDLALGGDRFRRQLGQRRAHALIGELGEAEVEDLDLSLGVDHDVRGLQVAMDDAFLVGGGHRFGQRYGDLEELLETQAAGWHDVVEPPPFHQLHGEEVEAIGLFHRVDGDDVGMIEGGDGLGLALESLQALLAGGEIRREDFQSNVPPQCGVFGPVDLTHPALAELGGDSVVGKRGADHLLICRCQQRCARARQTSCARSTSAPGLLTHRPKCL